MRATSLFLALALCTALASAGMNISNTLGSNMVLQRAPQQAVLWGWVDVGETVTVTFSGQNIPATVSAGGSWLVKLPATYAGGPYSIGIASSAGDKIVLNNILFGDVYICSGQSNMQFTVDQAFNASLEVSIANEYGNIRIFSVGQTNTSNTPLDNLIQYELGWSTASSSTVGGGNWTYMSAVCWFFGKDLYNQYQVPIGLISSNWGGTIIQAWSSPDALAQCNQTGVPAPTPAPGPAAASFSIAEPPNPNLNSVLWNAMISPFLRMAIKGAVWYQGESNVGQDVLYSCLFPAMISDWRAKFNNVFPFFFVQLAPWLPTPGESSVDVALLRTSQLSALNLTLVGYASAVDLGDAKSPFGSIHPRNKQTVGTRLCKAAQHIAYGASGAVWQGPTFQSATQDVSNMAATVYVTFNTYGKTGLHLRKAVCPPGQPNATCENFQILLSDGIWHTATSVSLASTPNQVIVIVANLESDLTIKGVRYGYSIWPLINLFSGEGLPAIPFEHDFNS